MRWTRSTLTFALAGAAVAAAAWMPGATEAEAAPRNDFTRPLDVERDLHPKRGPFFALRVNSMDIKGEARTLSCFDYSCRDLRPANGLRDYQLVRHAFPNANVNDLRCDEVLKSMFDGEEIDYSAFVVTTRWIRKIGPSDTPVGGFIGKAWIRAAFSVGDERIKVSLIDLAMIGTIGMKPGRGEGADRCDTPLHDEGYYQGVFNKKALRKIQQAFRITDPARLRILKTLANSLVAGTFEGQITLDAADGVDRDYCDIASEGWWFDGLLAWRCKPHRDRPDDPVTDRVPPEDKPERRRGVKLEDAINADEAANVPDTQ